MSISVLRNLADLKRECQAKGLQVKQSGSRESKTDYVLALRQWHLDHDFPNGVPESLKLMLSIESPMLCKRYPELKPAEQAEIWTSDKWFLEEKIDGNRMVYMFLNGGFDSYSRNISVKDYLPESYGEKIYLSIDRSKITDSFILDSEVVSSNPNISTILENKGVITETQLQATTAILALNKDQSIEIQKKDPLNFITFDCLWFNGQWLLDKPLFERRKYLMKALNQLREAGFRCSLPKNCYKNDRKAFYNQIIANKGEGCVAKRIDAPYVSSNTRSAGFWIKIKRNMQETLKNAGISDSLDGWVSGFEPADENKGQAGLVGSIDISAYLEDDKGNLHPHVIARVSNLPLELKKQMTELVDGKPQLKQEFYGRVCEVNGQAVSARAQALKHATFVRWRPDRSADTCIISKSFWESMIL